MVAKPPISADDQIEMFIHCGQCVTEWSKRGHARPADEARLNVGWTARGLQVWCERHQCNVLNIDFEGHKHPAITTCKGGTA